MTQNQVKTSPHFWYGTLAGLIVTFVGYWTYRVIGLMFWPEIAAQWSFAIVHGEIQTVFINTLGADAKILGLYVAMLVQILMGGVIAYIAPQARWIIHFLMLSGIILVTTFGFTFISSAVQLPDLPMLISGLLLTSLGYALIFALLRRDQPAEAKAIKTETLAQTKAWTRRRWLSALGTVAGSAILWPLIRNDLNPVKRILENPQVPVSTELVDALRQGRIDYESIPNVSTWLTPEPDFYYVSKNLSPFEISLEDWGSLTIDGMVDEPLKLTFQEIQSLPQIDVYYTLQCIDFDPYNAITEDLVGNGKWTGVSLKHFLERAKIKPGGIDLVLQAGDGYSDSLPIETVLQQEDIILAWALNDQPLSAQHGFPLRLIVPGQYGMKNIKHVDRLEVINNDYKGYWQQRGWVDDAPINTYAKLETISFADVFEIEQPVIVAGWAFAGTRGISKVEVSSNNGETWTETQLEIQREPNTWVRWAYLWQPDTLGQVGVISRAFDGNGLPQIEKRTGAFPDGTTGYHRVWVDVVDSTEAETTGA